MKRVFLGLIFFCTAFAFGPAGAQTGAAGTQVHMAAGKVRAHEAEVETARNRLTAERQQLDAALATGNKSEIDAARGRVAGARRQLQAQRKALAQSREATRAYMPPAPARGTVINQ